MTDFNEPVYVYDFRSTLNCATTESASPGQEIDVLVRKEKQLTAPAVKAKGTRSADGKLFKIDVQIDGRVESHSWPWAGLLEAINLHRGTPAERAQ